MHKRMFKSSWRTAIISCIFICACSEDNPETIHVSPEIPSEPKDSIPITPQDSMTQDNNSPGLNTTINGWNIDSIDNGGAAQ